MKKLIQMTVMMQVVMALTSVAWAEDKAVKVGSVAAGLVPLIVIILLIGLYFVPTIVGYVRKKDNKMSILMLNLFLGWTLVGWVVSLVWAVSKDKVAVQNIYVQQAPPTQQ